MVIKKVIVFFLFIILVSLNVLNAVDNNFYKKPVYFRNYNIGEGLISNTVKCITEDEYGYVWLGTDKGLSRFDGYEFVNYKPAADEPHSLHASFIRSLLVDSKGRMWVGTEGSLERFYRKEERFELKFPLSQSNSLYIDDLLEDSRGNIWAASDPYGLLKYDAQKDSFVVSEINDYLSVSIRGITTLMEDSRGYLWIGTHDLGAFRIDLENKKSIRFQHEANNKNSIPFNNVTAFQEDSAGNIWIATYGGGISKYNPKNKKFKLYQADHGKGLSSNLVFSFIIDKNQKFWIVSESGLDYFSPQTGDFRNYSQPFIQCSQVYTRGRAHKHIYTKD